MSYCYMSKMGEVCIVDLFNPITDFFIGGVIVLLIAIILELKYPEYGLKQSLGEPQA